MDILIKGLDLTKGACDYNLTIHSDGEVEGSQQVVDRLVLIHTKAIEVPPHGPLADINKIKLKFKRAGEVCEATNKPERAKHWRDAEGLVNEAEIVLEDTEDGATNS